MVDEKGYQTAPFTKWAVRSWEWQSRKGFLESNREDSIQCEGYSNAWTQGPTRMIIAERKQVPK